MTTVLSDPKNFGNHSRLVIKGASELILECCSKFHSFSDEVTPLDSSKRTQILEAIENFASNALRTIILAYKELNESDGGTLYFSCLTAFSRPHRKGLERGFYHREA